MRYFIYTVLLAMPLLFHNQVKGQTTYIEYSYDAAGNRETRRVVVIGNQNARKSDSISTDTTTIAQNNKNSISNNNDALFSDKMEGYEISVYPNPTSGTINLNITGEVEKNNAMLEIYTDAGVKVFKRDKINAYQIIDFSSYPGGIYYLKLCIDGSSRTYKIIKTN